MQNKQSNCFAAAIERLRELAKMKRLTIACAKGVSTDWQDEQYDEMNILLTAAKLLEEDSAKQAIVNL